MNRLDGESKDFGYIVDYKELFGDLADAMNKYTAGAFESYDAEDVEKEIRGLYAAGLTGGYTTWHSGSNLEKYKAQKAAFCIDYLKEWKKANVK